MDSVKDYKSWSSQLIWLKSIQVNILVYYENFLKIKKKTWRE